jgi:hypothetical protein
VILTQRDKAIINDLNKFRVIDRDSIAELHFGNVKNPIKAANNVLLRLLREGKIQRTKETIPYCYIGPDVTVKKDSAKIGHYLSIAEVYKEIKRRYGSTEIFDVEPKYTPKGGVEPDVFTIFKGTPMFIEVQNSVISEKNMNEKLERYNDLFHSGIVNDEPWQPTDKKVFPFVLILSATRYAISKDIPFKVLQAESIGAFFNRLQKKPSTNQNETQAVQRRVFKG